MSGKMSIELDKTIFQPGETIEGTVTLHLNKPGKGRGVYISIFSSEGSGGGARGPGGKGGGGGSSKHVWDSQRLDSAKEYPAYQTLTYPFQLTAPSLSNPLAPLMGMWRRLTRDTSPRAPGAKSYWIEAKLDLDMAVDVSKYEAIKVFYTSPE